ncbi:Cysteine desulfurase [Gimesia alba]|uniref:cysteine desulfurase n=1 Tax=Gimesia alba TaxID=2527973 RepID=A0A517RF92_9PLAN|nr:cysteine desulfurase family protein [Gimesia alba]QDT42547.1 Cysteine desulfurase [Gimesia alba]
MTLTVYMDCHSTTPVDPRVIESMHPWWHDQPGNSSSKTHEYGRKAQSELEESRAKVASIIGAHSDKITFTSGSTESSNTVLFGLLHQENNDHLIVTTTEHKAILDPSAVIAESGIAATLVPVDQHGQTDLEGIEKAISPSTKLISVIYANNEVGSINPIKEIGAFCRERKILFHTDATQAVGKIPLDVSNLPIDLMSFSAHKLYGPQGIGALYVRNEEIRRQIRPLIYGGGHERGLRSGTVPVPLVAGFGKACELSQDLMQTDAQKIGAMRDRLWQRFQTEIPNVILNGHPTERLYNNLNVSFIGIPSEAFIIKLRDIVAVSAGSACTSANPEPSHVLKAMNVGHARLESAIRFGLGRFNTMDEVEFVADKVRDAVRELRG